MKMPDAYWTTTYSASRRKHHHRCASCRKIIADGETVFMARVVGKATKCMHDSCAKSPYGSHGYVGRDFLEAWGMEYLAACGWTKAKNFLRTAPICQVGGTREQDIPAEQLESHYDLMTDDELLAELLPELIARKFFDCDDGSED